MVELTSTAFEKAGVTALNVKTACGTSTLKKNAQASQVGDWVKTAWQKNARVRVTNLG